MTRRFGLYFRSNPQADKIMMFFLVYISVKMASKLYPETPYHCHNITSCHKKISSILKLSMCGLLSLFWIVKKILFLSAASMLVGFCRRKAFGYTAYVVVKAEETLSSISSYGADSFVLNSFAALLLPAISPKDNKYLLAA